MQQTKHGRIIARGALEERKIPSNTILHIRSEFNRKAARQLPKLPVRTGGRLAWRACERRVG